MKKLKSGSNQRKLINILQCRGEILGRLLGRLKLRFSAFWLKQVVLG